MNLVEKIAQVLQAQSSQTAKGSVYFVGIGGIGMSALARYFNAMGHKVSGYDKTETALTKQLVAEGIAVHYNDAVEAIDQDAILMIYTPAIPKTHVGLNFIMSNEFLLAKRSDVLGAITSNYANICVAGTHGKTTTSAMVGHLLQHTGYGCNAFLGGISVNYNSNFWSSTNETCVVEADEYDRSFLKLTPSIAVITAMDADHLDIYGTAEEVENAFIEFSKKVKSNGMLLSKHGLERGADLNKNGHFTYHLNDTKAHIYASNIKVNHGSYTFDVMGNGWSLTDIKLHMGGLHNIENMLAAIAIAKHLGIADEKIKAAVASFKGVKRRFEYIVKTTEKIYIDDYAHHPDELNALITGVKNLFPGKKTTMVFQPHLFTRTRDFAEGFAAALDRVDRIILLPIYPARELPIDGVNSEMLLALMKNENVSIVERDKVKDVLINERLEVLISAGAGDIDVIIPQLKEIVS